MLTVVTPKHNNQRNAWMSLHRRPEHPPTQGQQMLLLSFSLSLRRPKNHPSPACRSWIWRL